MAEGAGLRPGLAQDGPGPGLPQAPGPAVATAGAPRAPRGRPGGRRRGQAWVGSGQAGRRVPESSCRGRGAGGWAHLLQEAQQLRGLLHVAGLRLAHAVQDGVESLLVEQGPLRHSGVTSGPIHPPQGLSPTRPGTRHRPPAAGLGCQPPTLRPDSHLLRGEVVGWRLDLGSKVERQHRRPGSGPARRSRSSQSRPARHPAHRAPVPPAGLLGGRPPGRLPRPRACGGGGPWCSGPSSVSPRPRGPSFPSPEETARLIGGHARAPAAEVRPGSGGGRRGSWQAGLGS